MKNLEKLLTVTLIILNTLNVFYYICKMQKYLYSKEKKETKNYED